MPESSLGRNPLAVCRIKVLCIAATAVLVDQVTKWLVMQMMFLGESVSVLGSFFRLTYIHNPGAVFGLTFGGKYLHLLLAGAALVVVGIMLWRLPTAEKYGSLGLALVFGGAIGNVIDRLRFGWVVDFLDFGFGDVRWWIFNVADACVTVGAALLIISYGRQEKEDGAEIDTGGPS